ncbi:alpha/beta hydrolase domain-containing protein [Mycolicibacterium aurum]|uniref:Alpha/beta hydrolase domain-containing protein n=1 Tax=Mycolicibacterium aurum TaxID=1791 RepID=A0A448IJ51_MYCAU|nr:alpha/beta hydrolase [Mycolicibacterium aurum]VEG52440.1 alpha/beta hydrolase domain-containing protein [Mycolicibacterium aurum]
MRGGDGIGKGANFAVAAGIGAAVFVGLGCGVASADDTGSSSSASEAPASRDDGVKTRGSESDSRTAADVASEDVAADDPTGADDDPEEDGNGADVTEDDGADGADAAVTVDIEIDIDEDPDNDRDPVDDDDPVPAAVGHLLTTTAASRRDLDPVAPAPTPAPASQTLVMPANSLSYTDEPTLVDQIVVAGLRVLRSVSSVVGIDLYGQIGRFLERARPPWFVRSGLDVRRTEYEVAGGTWDVWEFHPPNPTGKTVIAVHGGGFILRPLVTHWLDYANMARDTGATVIVPMYPRASTQAGTALQVVPAMAHFISDQITARGAANVSLYADSAGSTLILAAVRELILAGTPVPAGMVLLSVPPDDAAGSHWNDGVELTDPIVSPLFLSDEVLAALPPTTIYVGELEPVLPNIIALQDKWSAAGGVVSTVIGRGQFHDWALGGLPFTSAGPKVRPDIYRQLGLNDVAAGPRTIVTGPPSYSDQLVVGILRTLRWLNETTGIKLLTGLAGASIITDPPAPLMRGLDVTEGQYNGWKIWEIASPKPSGEVVVALHGGGFESEANILHWSDYAQMARDTGATVLVPIYPLAPPKSTGTATTLVPPMADYLAALIATHGVDNVSLYGDSSGGSYAVLVVRELVQRCRIDVQCVVSQARPSRMVLVSPALHLTLRSPAIDAIDDPILPRHAAGEGPRFNGELDMDDPRVNPYSAADLTGLPPTTVYIGTSEKLYPGALAFRDKLLSQDPAADLTVVIGDGQMHGWALGGIVVNSQAPIWRSNVYRQLGLLPTDSARYVTLQVA